jgi:hypothetical protein
LKETMMQNLINTTPTPAAQNQNDTAVPTSPSQPMATPQTQPVMPSKPYATSYQQNPNMSSPQMNQKGSMKKVSGLFIALCLVAIIGGGATGAGIYKLNAKGTNGGSFEGQPIQTVAGDKINNGQIFGSPNENDFKDSAEGYLEIGGLDGEGSHKLLREGGPSQTVYLTSSVTDLDKFKGMHVKVWGETFKGQKVGWLMDVGRVQVIETKAQPPAEPAAPATKNSKTPATKATAQPEED